MVKMWANLEIRWGLSHNPNSAVVKRTPTSSSHPKANSQSSRCFRWFVKWGQKSICIRRHWCNRSPYTWRRTINAIMCPPPNPGYRVVENISVVHGTLLNVDKAFNRHAIKRRHCSKVDNVGNQQLNRHVNVTVENTVNNCKNWCVQRTTKVYQDYANLSSQ